MFQVNKSIKELSRYKLQLNSEYLAVFDEIIVYLRLSSLPEKDVELILQDILSNFLQSQGEGKQVGEIMGGDYKSFCDELITAYQQDYRSRARMRWNEGANLFLALSILIAIDFLFKNVAGNLLRGQEITLHYTATLNFVILWALVLAAIWYIFRVVKKQTFVEKVEVPKSERFIIGLIMALPFIMLMVSRGLKLDKMAVFSTNGLALMITILLLSMVCRWLSNR